MATAFLWSPRSTFSFTVRYGRFGKRDERTRKVTSFAQASAFPDGSVDPHDILRIKGVSAVQEYIVNEIQEVYRMQGVKINDKHIEVIARQMLHKVRITDSGDTRFPGRGSDRSREVRGRRTTR